MKPKLFAAAVLLSLPLAAQWLSYKTPGIPRTPDGKPNLSAPAPRNADGKPDVVNLLDLQSHSQDFVGTAPIGAYSGVRMLIDSASSNVTITVMNG